ncbi:uncharacterized protein K452DRAFT_20005 [Aplosporella prunicola CBS 121167]|uniref:Uncharacterized protein n=1 Tax=Aplosporella prunicola CBS 121167 TaxID=1176127 RepID=A0A6A6BEM5_9PEZI|nr:uncharacterized protein K452DRAFT_20005 [Aplosporella prunicola CBS 121167]KAF2142516.1 hypothetical protein K452DRAFT_20005 [Aplosporella prunicola CBS 121167]
MCTTSGDDDEGARCQGGISSREDPLGRGVGGGRLGRVTPDEWPETSRVYYQRAQRADLVHVAVSSCALPTAGPCYMKHSLDPGGSQHSLADYDHKTSMLFEERCVMEGCVVVRLGVAQLLGVNIPGADKRQGDATGEARESRRPRGRPPTRAPSRRKVCWREREAVERDKSNLSSEERSA